MNLLKSFDDLMSHLNSEDNDMAAEFRAKLESMPPPELKLLKSGLYGCRLDMSIQTPDWANGYNTCRNAVIKEVQ